MEAIKGRFPSADGKNSIAWRIWEPECGAENAVGIMQISHGMSEYSARYEDYAAHLNAMGYIVGANDHLGHGETAPDEKSLGYLTERNCAGQVVEDVHTMTLLLKEKYPGKPLFLLGHSMGSFIARCYLSQYAEELTGAIIMGTAGPGAPTGLGIFVADAVSLFRGRYHRSALINAMALGSYNKRFGGRKADKAAWLSKNTENIKRYADDPLCGFTFTAGGFRTMFELLENVSLDTWAKTVPTDLPVLLISGGDDPVGNYGEGVRRVASMLIGEGSRSISVHIIPGDRHEILNEDDREEVYSYIDGWMKDILTYGLPEEDVPEE